MRNCNCANNSHIQIKLLAFLYSLPVPVLQELFRLDSVGQFALHKVGARVNVAAVYHKPRQMEKVKKYS